MNILNVIQITFLIVIISSLVRLFFNRDTEENLFQKIIGGFSVFTIAFIANTTSVYIFSLLIGGLIIASEDFMKFLTAIMRSNSDKVGEVIQALKISEATPKDVVQKIDHETEEETRKKETLNKDSNITIEENHHLAVNNDENSRNQIKREIKEFFNNFYQSKYDNYKPYIKLSRNNIRLIVDGAIVSDIGNVKEVFEFRYATSKDSLDSLKHITHRLQKKFFSLGINPKITTIIILNQEISDEEISRVVNSVEWKINLAIFEVNNIDTKEINLRYASKRFADTLNNINNFG